MKTKIDAGKIAKRSAGPSGYDQMIRSDEFVTVMRDTEEKPFMTANDAIKEFEKWLTTRGKN
jgi:hypothetical protein